MKPEREEDLDDFLRWIMKPEKEKEEDLDDFFMERFHKSLEELNYDEFKTKFLIIPKGENKDDD